MKNSSTFKEHGASFKIGLRTLDVIVIFLCGWVTHFTKFGTLNLNVNYKILILLGLLTAISSLSFFGSYTAWRGSSFSKEIRSVFLALGSTLLILSLCVFATQTSVLYSRVWMATWMSSSIFFVLFYRYTLRLTVGYLRKKGLNIRKVIIIGGGEMGESVANRLIANPELGLVVQGFITDKDSTNLKINDIPILGRIEDINKIVSQKNIDQVWIALPLKEVERMQKVQTALATTAVTIRMVPDIYGFQLLNQSMTEVAGLPIINLSTSHMLEGNNRFIKACEDKLLAFLILLLISPILLILSAMVKLSSPGPVFYRQERVSWNGRAFNMLKFRSMTIDSEKDGVKWGGATSMSVTKVGRFIRKTSLDELPQFINVLKGDMSIVGPRPERPIFVEQFKHEIPGYMKKHMVKAGITGWAQVNGWRGDTDLQKRIEYDLFYIEHWSLWLDFKIILMTLLTGFVNKNAK